MTTISLVVLTYNEEVNLPHCLESVGGLAERLFVVDSGSDDRTQQVARDYGAHVVQHPFETQAQQFNWALNNLPIQTEWVLRLDADEYIEPALREEISKTVPTVSPNISGFYIKRRVIFQGRWIRFGGYYPTWLLRLFRYGKGRSEVVEMDEHLVVSEGKTRRLENDIVDHNRKGLSFWTEKHEGFAEREARAFLRRTPQGDDSKVGRFEGEPPERTRWLKYNVYYKLPPFIRAGLYFVYRYIFRLGFLDGREGLVFHVLQGFWYRFYVDAKIMELRASLGGEEDL